MDQSRPSQEILERHIAILGDDLGRFYHELFNEVAWVNAKWQQYKALFGASPKRVEVLNEAAAFFFKIVQDVLWDDITLHLARLTDPPQSMGRDNLTLKGLASRIRDPTVAASVENQMRTVEQRCSFARHWRNKHLAHRDLATALVNGMATKLPTASRADVEGALSAMNQAMNVVHGHYFRSHMVFERFVATGDADQFIFLLSDSLRMWRSRQARLAAGRATPEDLLLPDEI